MLISVNGFDEAKAYPVLFNSTELLMDSNRDVFYVKAVDGLGKYAISTYKFEKMENEKPLTAENFVTREQFESLSGKLDLLLNSVSSSVPPQPEAPTVATQPTKGGKT